MSLNHKRRIFRPSAAIRLGSPATATWLLGAGAAAALIVLTSLFLRSPNAPVGAPAVRHVSAGADQLAVLDGDTLRVGAHVVRLEGISAPARGSVCHGAGQLELDCGSAAANALADLVRGNSVDCAIHGHDSQGRPTAECSAAGRTLNLTLVQSGWARAETAALLLPERTAKAAGLGIWRAGS